VFASAHDNSHLNRFKKVQHSLATISGFAPLPPLSHLGYHFSKYGWVSADRIIERNQQFTDFGLAVDVLWMDITYAD